MRSSAGIRDPTEVYPTGLNSPGRVIKDNRPEFFSRDLHNVNRRQVTNVVHRDNLVIQDTVRVIVVGVVRRQWRRKISSTLKQSVQEGHSPCFILYDDQAEHIRSIGPGVLEGTPNPYWCYFVPNVICFTSSAGNSRRNTENVSSAPINRVTVGSKIIDLRLDGTSNNPLRFHTGDPVYIIILASGAAPHWRPTSTCIWHGDIKRGNFYAQLIMVSRCYCFTLNNYTDEDVEQLSAATMPVKAIGWGREVGESGTPHLQGYLELTKPMRIAGLKKLGGAYAKMHLETRRGSREEAIAYCGKEAPWEAHGNWDITQGSRTDLDITRQRALEGGMREVTLTGNAQQIKVAEKFLTYHEEPRDWHTQVDWYWGPTGTGKSRRAREDLANCDLFVKNDGSRWWDGYDGHEAVILDDFRDSWWSLTETLSLLDRYEKRVEVKGGWRQFVPKRIIVTSAKHPATCYAGTGEDVQQLLRRIGSVTEFRNEVGGGNTEPLLPDEDIEKILAELC